MCAWRGRQPNESTPLLVNNAVRDQDVNNGCCAVRKWSLFYFFCFLSGQYINFDTTEERPSKCSFKKLVSIAGLILFVWQLFLHWIHNAIAMDVEFFRIGNISFTTNYDTIQCSLPQEHWKFSSAITISTFASFVS